jgi:hypothetical protein
MSRTQPHRQDRHLFALCPRCGTATTIDHAVCTNPNCAWPNPEPGLISMVRLNLGRRADGFLQKLREVGKWPPAPR